MDVIAERGGTFLVTDDGVTGCVIDTPGRVGEPLPVQGILARGYWRSFGGDPDAILSAGIIDAVAAATLPGAGPAPTIAPEPVAIEGDEMTTELELFDSQEFLDALLAAAETGVPQPWRAVLAREGEVTADNRVIDPGALAWRPLPLTLMAMIVNSEGGHIGSEVCGRIDRIYRDGMNVIGEGVFDTGDYGTEIARLVRERTLRGVSVDISTEEMEFRPKPGAVQKFADDGEALPLAEVMAVTKGLLLGATVCPFQAIGSATIEVLDQPSLVAAGYDAPLVIRYTIGASDPFMADLIEAMTQPMDVILAERGFAADPDVVIMDGDTPVGLVAAGDYGGAAVLLYPELEEAGAIALPNGEPAEKLHVTLAFCPGANPAQMQPIVASYAAQHPMMTGRVSGTGSFDDSGQGGDGNPGIAIPSIQGLAAFRTGLVQALEDAGVPVSTDYDFVPHLTLGYSPDGPLLPSHEGRVGQPLTFRALTLSSKAGDRHDYPFGGVEITAAALGLAPALPPLEWFDNPRLGEPTPLTVTDDGRVFGHVAQWNVCHIGNPAGPGVCVTAPKSPTQYSNFHLGELVTAEGTAIAVGQLTIDTGHAPLGITPKQAVAHYDNTGNVVAHVRCGEDRHGIWFAGAVCPDVGESLLRKFRGAKISGDWRKVNGRVDMIGAHCVNIPGFPIPRPAARVLVASAADDREGLLALVAAGIVGENERPPADVQARIEALAARAQGRDFMIAVALGES